MVIAHDRNVGNKREIILATVTNMTKKKMSKWSNLRRKKMRKTFKSS